ncbi:ComEA family DNA-binding protein [Enterovibrio paralichthyis]|uniref:ComEA family DNA-binding protein n=1 Tax=Enterovibrio paralichthyis TaxID=2853805 RepID=UPI001C45044F|nr:ComEA family DNA-binding protein [Enterovibrio paralichthyis]MBV7299556.1 ComEA family DNA-binding protein [Enterovibrio paralichthyis]
MKTFISALIFAATLIMAPIASAEAVGTDNQIEVNINVADVEELDKYLDGIGKAKAQAIVDYRNANGDFESVEALESVKGIGPAIIEKNRDRIVL